MHDEDEDEEMIANSAITGSNNEHNNVSYSSYASGQVYGGTPDNLVNETMEANQATERRKRHCDTPSANNYANAPRQ
ncbi:hypothetical protein BGZ82_009918 [Podila clonocystis]|nr:hypothetical protein BGZ82_009918 [Podila clonocystis]